MTLTFDLDGMFLRRCQQLHTFVFSSINGDKVHVVQDERGVAGRVQDAKARTHPQAAALFLHLQDGL